MEGVGDLLYYGPTLMVYYHYRKYGFIRRSKPTNIPSKSTNIVEIRQLTNESTEEYNSDEFKSTYSSVPMNVTIYSSVKWHR
jgi:hypothetical protein